MQSVQWTLTGQWPNMLAILYFFSHIMCAFISRLLRERKRKSFSVFLILLYFAIKDWEENLSSANETLDIFYNAVLVCLCSFWDFIVLYAFTFSEFCLIFCMQDLKKKTNLHELFYLLFHTLLNRKIWYCAWQYDIYHTSGKY